MSAKFKSLSVQYGAEFVRQRWRRGCLPCIDGLFFPLFRLTNPAQIPVNIIPSRSGTGTVINIVRLCDAINPYPCSMRP
jgi:hypothetical protein